MHAVDGEPALENLIPRLENNHIPSIQIYAFYEYPRLIF